MDRCALSNFTQNALICCIFGNFHSDSANSRTLKIVCYLPQVIHRFYQRYTGLELERIEEETDRDNFMSPKQAQDLGIIDGVILSSDLGTPAATTAAVAA